MTEYFSHARRFDDFTVAYEATKKRLVDEGDTPYTNVKEKLELLENVIEIEFGRYLMQTGGFNGYWIDYLIQGPKVQPHPKNRVENLMLNHIPTCLATRQRYGIFQKLLQKTVKDGAVLASIPCGIMRDLLTLDYTQANGVKLIGIRLVGIDMDLESFIHAKDLAKECGLIEKAEFRQEDAWHLEELEEFDTLSSNGLNIYVEQEDEILELYNQFNKALKPGGELITSFVTPPPVLSDSSPWKMDQLDPEVLRIQKILFVDIFQARWQCYRTHEEMENHLSQCGFKDIEFFNDDRLIFPTVRAVKK